MSEDRASSGGALRKIAMAILRVVFNLIILFGAYIGIQLGIGLLAKRVPADWHVATVAIGFVALCVLMVLIYVLLVRLTERRSADEIAFAPGLALAGALFGAALFCSVYAVLWFLHVAQWQGFSLATVPVIPLALALAAGFGEEITFRGGIFRVLEDKFGTLIALAVSATLFGLLHAFNPGATVASTAAIAVEAGVLLGLAYAVTRNLWFPIGLHFGWNFTEGGVFGEAVSGHAAHGIVHASLSGPQMLTGGSFGPEASIVAVGVSVAASIVLGIIAISRGRWTPMGIS